MSDRSPDFRIVALAEKFVDGKGDLASEWITVGFARWVNPADHDKGIRMRVRAMPIASDWDGRLECIPYAKRAKGKSRPEIGYAHRDAHLARYRTIKVAGEKVAAERAAHERDEIPDVPEPAEDDES